MNIAVVGTGYVGLVSGVCLASIGHTVVGIDIDAGKIAGLQAGDPGIFEKDLDELLARQLESGRLSFSTEIQDAADSDVLLIAVGTPQRDSGEADLSAVYGVTRSVAPHLKPGAVVATKSTVPVGTGDILRGLLDDAERSDIRVGSNPEFLRQGHAVDDFLHPDRVVVGADDPASRDIMAAIYKPIADQGAAIIETDIKTAELIKYAANTFLATKLAYANEIADLCEIVGASIEDVTHAVGLDDRISPSYMRPGPGFGGSCLPKDTEALLHTFAVAGARSHVLAAAIESNKRRRAALADRVVTAIGYRPRHVAVWGLTFKADTDDLRDSPSIDLIRGLANRSIEVSVYDPLVEQLPDDVPARLTIDALAAAEGADAVVVATEWPEFRNVDLDLLAKEMTGRAVIDLRNTLDSDDVNRAGLDYFPIGRPSSHAGVSSSTAR